MKNQVTTLMEALRLAGLQFEKHRNGQSVETTLDALEAILMEPEVTLAAENLEALVSPPLQPSHEDQWLKHRALI